MIEPRRSFRRAFELSLALFTALTWAGLAWASPDKRADAEALTQSLVALNAAFQKAAPSAKAQALQHREPSADPALEDPDRR